MNSDLIEKVVGAKLPGKDVLIRFRRPPEPFGGYAFRHPDGRLGIDIDPGLSDVEQFRLLLHELSHLRLHSGDYKASDPYRQVIQRVDPENYGKQPKERQAARQAEIWIDHARRNFAFTPKQLSTVDRLLSALLLPDLEKMITRAAQAAAKRVKEMTL